jgi:hypothetical protein
MLRPGKKRYTIAMHTYRNLSKNINPSPQANTHNSWEDKR